jgi:16S rRNA processing protein RimM
MAERTDRLIIGRITAPFGIQGWVKVHAYTQSPENLLGYRHCDIGSGDQWQPAEIVAGRRHGDGLAVRFKGCDDRDAAERLARMDIAVQRDQLPALGAGEYYWHQLIGLKVLSVLEDGSEVLLGQVSNLLETGSNDVLVVKPCEGSLDQRERLLPYLPGQFVLGVALEEGVIRVDWDPEF